MFKYFVLFQKLLYALLDGKDDKSIDKDNLPNSKSCNHFRFGKCKITKNISTNERRLLKLFDMHIVNIEQMWMYTTNSKIKADKKYKKWNRLMYFFTKKL